MRKAILTLAPLCGLALLITACPASLDDFCANRACEATSVGEGGADTGADGPVVDPCVSNPSDPKCLDDSTAFFVSASGSETGEGTRAAPLKSINAALAKVTADKKRIYVCEGSYPEKVEIRTSVSILGGLNCQWTAKGSKPVIAPPTGVAVSILKASGVALSEVVTRAAADVQVKGSSAIAVFVAQSAEVLLTSVEVTAGAAVNGEDGPDGDSTPNYTPPLSLAQSGITASGAGGGAAPNCGVCADASFSTGGRGADDGATPAQGTASPAVGGNNSGASGGTCGVGKDGAPGLAAGAATGASSPGVVSSAGWDLAPSSKAGSAGNPGQGGGGGGSEAGAGGGSGGCGGCGGSGGGGGGNGGSSIALLVFESDVTVDKSVLVSSQAGAGGRGGKGQAGQRRGGGGPGVCNGGNGGHGAGGGGGGGGAGGHSVPLAFSGKPPARMETQLTAGGPGAFGEGGEPGTSSANPGAKGNPGAVGSNSATLEL